MKSSLHLAMVLIGGIKWRILGFGALYALFAILSLNMLLSGNESAALLISPILAAALHRLFFFTMIDSNRFRTLQLLPVDRATKGRALWWCSVGMFLCLVCAVINPLVIWAAVHMHSQHEASMRTLLLFWTTLCLGTFGIFKALPAALAITRRALEACKLTPPYLILASVLLSAVTIFFYAQLPRSLESESSLWGIAALLGLIAAIESYVRSARLMDFVENLLDAKIKARANSLVQRVSRAAGRVVPHRDLSKNQAKRLTGWVVPAEEVIKNVLMQTAAVAVIGSIFAAYDKHLDDTFFLIVPLVTPSVLIVGYAASIRSLRTLPLTPLALALILNATLSVSITIACLASIAIGALMVEMSHSTLHLMILACAVQVFSMPIALIFKNTTGFWAAFRPFFILPLLLGAISKPVNSLSDATAFGIAAGLFSFSVLWTTRLIQTSKKVYRISSTPDPTKRKFSFFDAAPPRQ